MNECPVCKGQDHYPTVLRHSVPVHQNLLVDSQGAAIETVRGDLDIVTCKTCGFVFNRRFDEALLSYGGTYENAQHHSPFFSQHMNNLIRLLTEEYGVRNAKIAEIGCGKGDFLKLLVEPEEYNNCGIGLDPSYTGNDVEFGGRLKFIKNFFGAQDETIDADFIVCRHVIEHVSDPIAFLKSIRMAVPKASKPRFFFETPCVDWILENDVIWDFFYEHCSLFSRSSLTNCFKLAGFAVDSVRHVFCGQYLWIEAHISDTPEALALEYDNATLALAQRFKANLGQIEAKWKECLRNSEPMHKLAVWGAGAKGTTFVNLFDPNRQYVDCLIDLNPAKQGHFVPGTGHPIISPYSVKERGVDRAIVMNPNYMEESRLLIQKSNIALTLME